MIFISGITSKTKDLNFSSKIICPSCGGYGRIDAFMTYTGLSLFFIPVFKWNKEYFGRTSCCNTTFSISEEIGKKIEKSQEVDLREEDLRIINKGYRPRICRECKKTVAEDYDYCPYCGRRME